MLNEKILSKRCIYALRAIFELSFRNGDEPVTIEEIANAQDIPARFLEVIMLELKKGGIVDSVRGNEGGFRLAVSSNQISVSHVIKLIWGKAKENDNTRKTHNRGDYVFSKLWNDITSVTERILSNTNFEGLVEDEKRYLYKVVPNYVI